MELTWTYKSFDELTPHELYAILQLRIEVFAVETLKEAISHLEEQ